MKQIINEGQNRKNSASLIKYVQIGPKVKVRVYRGDFIKANLTNHVYNLFHSYTFGKFDLNGQKHQSLTISPDKADLIDFSKLNEYIIPHKNFLNVYTHYYYF